jgi:hypothetical protein
VARFVSLSEAVRDNLNDGDVAAFEGFTHLIPHAAAHEAIRQGFKDLTLIRMTPDVVYDQMVGMGMAKKVIFSYVGNPGVGLLRRVRDAVENNWPHAIETEEHSHAAMANAYEAVRGRPAARAIFRGYRGAGLAQVNPNIKLDHLPVHRRGTGGHSVGAAGRDLHPRAEGQQEAATCWSRASSASRRKRCWRPSAPSSPSRKWSTISRACTPT